MYKYKNIIIKIMINILFRYNMSWASFLFALDFFTILINFEGTYVFSGIVYYALIPDIVVISVTARVGKRSKSLDQPARLTIVAHLSRGS